MRGFRVNLECFLGKDTLWEGRIIRQKRLFLVDERISVVDPLLQGFIGSRMTSMRRMATFIAK
jgi:hypothetical protein